MTNSPFISSAARPRPILSRAVCLELWARILTRLKSGEVLITNRDFQDAIETEYRELTGAQVDVEARQCISQMVAFVNSSHPETYLTQGMQNGITQAFETGVNKLKWDLAKVQAKGVSAIRRFRRQENIRELLKTMHVHMQTTNIVECVRHAIEVLEGTARTAPALPAPRS